MLVRIVHDILITYQPRALIWMTCPQWLGRPRTLQCELVMFCPARSVGSRVVIVSAGFFGLPHLRSEIVFASDIYELSSRTPPRGVNMKAYAGVHISRSSTQNAPLGK